MDKMHAPANLIELARQLKAEGVPQDEWERYYNVFLEQKARQQAIPMHGSFELTPQCNLDCKMCYVHLTPGQFHDVLKADEWKEIILQAHRAGMMQANLTGGECLLYPGFMDLYRYMYQLGVVPCILTNGILANENFVREMQRFPPKMIQISLYGSSEDAYEKVTGHRCFSLVMENLKRLHSAHVPVKITITPNIHMRGDIGPLLKLVSTLGIPSNVNANLILPRKNTGRTLEDLTVDEYVEIYKTRAALTGSTLAPVEMSELPDESHEETRKYGLLCGAGRSAFGVTHQGRLCPCLSFDEYSIDLRSTDFASAWKKVNRYAEGYPLPAECGECIYLKRCLPCIAMHKNAVRPGHCDTRICERTKKLTAAGFVPVPGEVEKSE